MEHVMDVHIKKRKGLIKALIFLAFVISAIVVVRFTPVKNYLTTEALTAFGHQNWGRTKVERRQLKHELKNKAVFRP